MGKRKSLSKKIRFEVFKRDSFTCQYCGGKAPDVILEVDHINPVKEGGENDILNLVTSCFDCNRGKRDLRLSDTSVVEKQRKQIEELGERRQQLEMMLDWRNGLRSIRNEEYRSVIDYWNNMAAESQCTLKLNKNGEDTMIKMVRRYGVINVMNAIDVARDNYGMSDGEKFETAFSKLGGILYLQDAPEYKRKISYIKGICKNKFHDLNEWRASVLLNEFHQSGGDLDLLKDKIIDGVFNDWCDLRRALYSYLEDLNPKTNRYLVQPKSVDAEENSGGLPY